MKKLQTILLAALTCAIMSSYICQADDNTVSDSTSTYREVSTSCNATYTPKQDIINNETAFSLIYDDMFVCVEGTNIDEKHGYDLPEFNYELGSNKYYIDVTNKDSLNLENLSEKIGSVKLYCRNIYVIEDGYDITLKNFTVKDSKELLNVLNDYPVEKWTRIYFSDGSVIITNNRGSNLGILRFGNRIVSDEYIDSQNSDYWVPLEMVCDKKINCGVCQVVQYYNNELSYAYDSILQKAKEKVNNDFDKEDATSTLVTSQSATKKTSDNHSIAAFIGVFLGTVGVFMFKRKMN